MNSLRSPLTAFACGDKDFCLHQGMGLEEKMCWFPALVAESVYGAIVPVLVIVSACVLIGALAGAGEDL